VTCPTLLVLEIEKGYNCVEDGNVEEDDLKGLIEEALNY
jgi:hypothetical protein